MTTKTEFECSGGCGKKVGMTSWVSGDGKLRFCDLCFRILKKDSGGRPS